MGSQSAIVTVGSSPIWLEKEAHAQRRRLRRVRIQGVKDLNISIPQSLLHLQQKHNFYIIACRDTTLLYKYELRC
jgi:hypothetical protein